MKLIVQLIFLLLPAFIHTKCCYRTSILFKINNEHMTCKDFGATPYASPFGLVGSAKQNLNAQLRVMAENRECKIKVCGDGEWNDSFCGCKSDGGCIKGDPVENFFKINGNGVSNSGPDLIDRAQNAILKYF